jgi:hypothetical protein
LSEAILEPDINLPFPIEFLIGDTPRSYQSKLSKASCFLYQSRTFGFCEDPSRGDRTPEFDYSSFYGKTGAGDPLLCGGGLAFLMTCDRTPFYEENSAPCQAVWANRR